MSHRQQSLHPTCLYVNDLPGISQAWIADKGGT